MMVSVQVKVMDADSSYGGSDTAQDSHSSLDNSHSSHNISKHDNNEDTVTTAVHVMPNTTDETQTPVNHYYHKNEITLPVNLDDTDFQKNNDSKLHYLATANLNINESLEHHNNLDEMSKNYKSQHNLQESFSKKTKHSPPPTGIDNPAFVEDVKSTFNNDMPYSNGLTPDPSKKNNHEPVTEAVNLELINMKPGGAIHNGLKGYESSGMTTIPLKKEEEDMRSPYDEYFVPVNEHRKYMRGEKLYVTKDNRIEKSKGKCICWTICIALATIAVVVGILAAAGLLGSQPPMPQAIEASGRSLDNDTPIRKGGISLPTIGHKYPLTPEPPISTVSSIIPSTDESQIHVPRLIESELKIDNLEFNTALLDKDSLEYKALSEEIENQIKEVLLLNKELRNGTMDFDIKVMEILPGSVVTKYRVTWKPKDEYKSLEDNNMDPINEVSLNKILIDYLKRHRDLMGEFHIQENSIRSQRVLDLCKIQNNGCEHFCVFDYTKLNFACLCPEGQRLSSNQKLCKIDIMSKTVPDYIMSKSKAESTTIRELIGKSEPGPEVVPESETTSKVKTDAVTTSPEPKVGRTSISEYVTDEISGFDVKTSSTNQPSTKDYSMDFNLATQDVGTSMGDYREPTTVKLPSSIFSAIPVEFPTEKYVDEIEVSSDENKDRHTFYFDPILSGPPIEKTTETPSVHVTENDITYIPNLTVHPVENWNKTETEHKMETISTEKPTTGFVADAEFSFGNVYTPPAEVHFDVTTKKSSMYMIQVLKPLIHKEKFREPKIQELHMSSTNSSQMENNNTTNQYIDDAMDNSEQNHDEYMSPFLPEFDNDTFVNSLHSEEHFAEHENHDNVSTIKSPSEETSTNRFAIGAEENNSVAAESKSNNEDNFTDLSHLIVEVTTKPPSLELDQINTTNPFDNDTSDATNLQRNEQFITKDLEIEPIKPEVMIIISDKNDMTTEIATTTENPNVFDTTTAEAIATTLHNINVDEENVTTDNSNIENINIIKENFNNDESANSMHYYTSTIKTEVDESNINIMEHTSTTEMYESVTENFITTENIQDKSKNIIVNEDINNITTTDNVEINTTELTTYNMTKDIESTDIDTNILTSTENSSINNTNNENMLDGLTETTTSINEYTTDISITVSDLKEHTTYETTMPSSHNNDIDETTMALDKIESETIAATSLPENSTNIKNFNDISSSTEDLIALETTTNTEGSTIPIILANQYEVNIGSNDVTTEVSETTTPVSNNIEANDENKEDNEISTQTIQITTANFNKEYQVKENVPDITTTEKLFVTHKTTTEILKVEEDSTENLSIIPLGEDQTEANIAKKETDKNIELTQNEIIMLTKNEEKPITENFLLPKASRCSPDQFQCFNGTSVKGGNFCVSIVDRCDSVLDCTDGSDELNCIEEGCPNNFQCASKECLKRHLVCDGIFNCHDGSDESNCDSWSCNPNEISCGISNRCIPVSWKCDGRKNCPDGSDEEGCTHTGSCPAQSFRCTEESSCMPNSWKCDGEVDCLGGEDESSCLCTEEEFKCSTGGGCIANSDRCDGIAQCLDKSDEWDCLKLDKLFLNLTDINDKEILQLQVKNNTWFPICMDWTLWNTTFADLVCQKLGYSASSALESVPNNKNSTSQISYVLSMNDRRAALNFVENNDRDCDQYVSISCQEYVCGNPAGVDPLSTRMVAGDKAEPARWSSLALVFNKKHNTYCTSTLVTPIWAVTSYSCIAGRTSQPINEEDWFLYAGGTNKGDVSSQVRKLSEIVIHPQTKFSNFGFKNDVVLLKMKKPVNIDVNVSAVCLPNNGIEPHQLCVVAGWGVDKPGEPVMQQYIHYLPVPLIDTDDCNSTKHYNGKITPDKICAGYTDSDTTQCLSDEGAPLMCFSDKTKTWELQGLLSHPSNCGSSNKHPAIYTAIDTTLRTWMSHIIGRQALATS
ncbi:uncharacterized protein LOC130903730 isoform X2 [Diorhabda carinulata]|uniref:uncharacterized protein LOC130903730 isoform X2 n=1 Tax=Diorhabda carinulata TaxID=1163345 RepID=UPI0025A224A2|nr:uncharacterized protein LOC130903730 isoform X2 [Diorhabda carinulata]